MKPLTEDEVRERYIEASLYLSFLDTQCKYELEKILHLTSEMFGRAWDRAKEKSMIEEARTPNSLVTEYEKVMYWLDRDKAYQNAKQVRTRIQNILSEENAQNEKSIKNDIKFKDHELWFMEQYKSKKDDFNTDEDCFEEIARLFKDKFGEKPSLSTVRRWAKDEGRN